MRIILILFLRIIISFFKVYPITGFGVYKGLKPQHVCMSLQSIFRQGCCKSAGRPKRAQHARTNLQSLLWWRKALLWVLRVRD